MRKLRETTTVNTTGHKGNAGHPLYCTWRNMITRCYYTKSAWYHLYGGRGIGVCASWLDFNNFAADVGDKPAKNYQLDRLDNNKDYGPDNFRWVTPSQNGANTRARLGKKYKGAYWHKQRGKWLASITVNYKQISLGLYHTEKEAAIAYNKAALEYFGEYANLNDIEEEWT